jgi:LmbE family N-acetylglucosaminyl deacetylase
MKRLLLIFAHPGDESVLCGGTIAKYTATGWKADLVCATTGTEASRGQLQKAGIALGINSITFLGYREGTLAALSPGELEDTVYKKMEELVPDAVITMDTTGINNDQDHIKMCFVTTYAYQKYAAWIEEQLKDQFPKLYYACLPESVAGYLQKKKILPSESFGKPWRGTEDKDITTVINIMRSAADKKKALTWITPDMTFQTAPKHEYFILRMQGTTEVFMGKGDHVANHL